MTLLDRILCEADALVEASFKKLNVFDFDGTLVYTPRPETHRDEYKKATGKEWPFKGWWGRVESLSPPLESTPNKSVIAEFKKAKKDASALTVILTGRGNTPEMGKRIERILRSFGVDARLNKNLFLRRGPTTLSWKVEKVKELSQDRPSIKRITFWEDRAEHAAVFRDLSRELDAYVTVNKVD